MSNDLTRWEVAQQYEKNWWDKRSNSLDLEFYERFANELINFSLEHIIISQDIKILEIGSGASGILTYLKNSDSRYAIDPLESFYSKVRKFAEQRDDAVKYFAAKGEKLPFKGNKFDLIIMDNVLDHCDAPIYVMKELKRVLEKDGVVYFKQNTYHLWGKLIRYLMEIFLIDKGHPFTFSKHDLSKLLIDANFAIVKSAKRGYFYSWKKEILSGSLKDKIKALLFVTRDKVTYLLVNNDK